MKRLFTVREEHFESKEEAKAYRDELLSQHQQVFPVKLGPEHWRYGVKGNPRTHSHKRQAKKLFKQ